MPVVPENTSDLLALIQRERVISPERLAEYLRDRPIAGLPSLPNEAARRLVKDGLLSEFQAQLLLLGHSNGLTLGRYKLLDLIGRGGMSSVFLADDTRLNRQVAVKVFTMDDDMAALKKRFEREARAVAAIDHPNVVRAFDFGEDGSLHYIVMEYVAGVDLHRLVKGSGPMPVELACHYGRQAALGLQAVHAAGLVHRDIKPGNFLATNQGDLKLCDLGIVRYMTRDQEPITDLHVAGSFLGTPQFLAPEQLENSHTADHRADIYGLGATVYYLLTAKPPRRKLLNGSSNVLTPPTPIARRRPDLPKALAKFLDRTLADDPATRPDSAAAFARFLESFLGSMKKGQSPSGEETQTHQLFPTLLETRLPWLRHSSFNHRPITESTPTLPCGMISTTFGATPRPRTHRFVRIALLVALVGLCLVLGFLASRRDLSDRVRERILMDKMLVGTKIDVHLESPGHIVLRGHVTSIHQRNKAVYLAEQTAGVVTVRDEIHLEQK